MKGVEDMSKGKLCRCLRCGKFTKDIVEVKTRKTIYVSSVETKRKLREFTICDQCYEEIAEGFTKEEIDDSQLVETLKKAVIAEK